MADGPMIALPALVTIREKLRPLELVHDLAVHRRALHVAAGLDASAFAHEQHFAERHLRADLALEFFDCKRVTFGDPVLLSTGFENCVRHGVWFLGKWARKLSRLPDAGKG